MYKRYIHPDYMFRIKQIYVLREFFNKRSAKNNTRKHSKCAYVLPGVLHGDFLSEIKYLFNLEGLNWFYGYRNMYNLIP
jgi:hypothetical protein